MLQRWQTDCSRKKRLRENILLQMALAYGRFIVKQRDANGTVTEVLYVARDITGEKKQEFEYQEQLKKIAQEAEKANVSKTDFLRRMSHDIRTPINGSVELRRLQTIFREIWKNNRSAEIRS